jgi:hypothetical protein
MKVYLVSQKAFDEDYCIRGIYSTHEKAEVAFNALFEKEKREQKRLFGNDLTESESLRIEGWEIDAD